MQRESELASLIWSGWDSHSWEACQRRGGQWQREDVYAFVFEAIGELESLCEELIRQCDNEDRSSAIHEWN